MASSKITSFDIAKRAGVSQPTVSRALSDSPLVNKDTRERIKAIAKELNYKFDSRKTATPETNTLALALDTQSFAKNAKPSAFLLSLIASIMHAATNRGYNILIPRGPIEKTDTGNQLEQCDGIIFLGNGSNEFSVIDGADQADYSIPAVSWGSVLPNQPQLFVGSDNVQGGYLATNHLINLQHKSIAFLGSVQDSSYDISARHAGYTKALLEAGMIVDPRLQFDVDIDGTNTEDVIDDLLAKVTAIICVSDDIGLAAISALQKRGRKIPDDISVVGFNDIPSAATGFPALTTIRQDTTVIAEALLNNVIKLIEGAPTQSIQLPVELVIRDSSSTLGLAHTSDDS